MLEIEDEVKKLRMAGAGGLADEDTDDDDEDVFIGQISKFERKRALNIRGRRTMVYKPSKFESSDDEGSEDEIDVGRRNRSGTNCVEFVDSSRSRNTHSVGGKSTDIDQPTIQASDGPSFQGVPQCPVSYDDSASLNDWTLDRKKTSMWKADETIDDILHPDVLSKPYSSVDDDNSEVTLVGGIQSSKVESFNFSTEETDYSDFEAAVLNESALQSTCINSSHSNTIKINNPDTKPSRIPRPINELCKHSKNPPSSSSDHDSAFIDDDSSDEDKENYHSPHGNGPPKPANKPDEIRRLSFRTDSIALGKHAKNKLDQLHKNITKLKGRHWKPANGPLNTIEEYSEDSSQEQVPLPVPQHPAGSSQKTILLHANQNFDRPLGAVFHSQQELDLMTLGDSPVIMKHLPAITLGQRHKQGLAKGTPGGSAGPPLSPLPVVRRQPCVRTPIKQTYMGSKSLLRSPARVGVSGRPPMKMFAPVIVKKCTPTKPPVKFS